jgi:hypothetical protein
VEVDVVRVGLPVQDEARRAAGGEPEVSLRELGHDLLLLRRIGGRVCRADEARVLAEHALAAGEPTIRVLLVDAAKDRGERLGELAILDERVREEAVAGHVIRALLDGALVRVDHQRA